MKSSRANILYTYCIFDKLTYTCYIFGLLFCSKQHKLGSYYNRFCRHLFGSAIIYIDCFDMIIWFDLQDAIHTVCCIG